MKWFISIMILSFTTMSYGADLPNMGSYSPLSKYMKRAQESKVAVATDPNRTRKASTNKKPWVGDSLQDMEGIVYPIWTPPGPPDCDPCEPWECPKWDPRCKWEPPDDCEYSPCPDICVVVRGYMTTGPNPPPSTLGAVPISGETSSMYCDQTYSISVIRSDCGDTPPLGWSISKIPYISFGGKSKVFNIISNAYGIVSFDVRIWGTCTGAICFNIELINSCTLERCTVKKCFTAVAYGPGCDSATTITGCPTKAVDFNSSTVLGTSVEGDYTWSLTGGGSLSGSTYTAPSSNANCSDNGVVSLLCDGVVIDSCTIASSSGTGWAAYIEYTYAGMACGWTWAVFGCNSCGYVGGCNVGDSCPNDYLPPFECVAEIYYYREYDCEDNDVGAYPPDQQACSAIGTSTSMNCAHEIPVQGVGGIVDVRTDQQKADGCCPDGLK